VEVQLHAFLTLAPDGSQWSASCPGLFISQGKRPRQPLDRGLGGPQSRTGCGGEKKKVPNRAGNRTPVIQPVAKSLS